MYDEFDLPALRGLGPVNVPKDGKYDRFAVRVIDPQLPVAARDGCDMAVHLTASELKKYFDIDALPSETGYQFRGRLLGMMDPKGTRVRMYFQGL